MTVRQLLARIGSDELTEWMAYSGLEPFGDVRSDYRAGVLAAVAVNSNPWRSRDARPATPADFFPPTDAPAARPQSVDEMKAVMAMHRALQAAKAKQRGSG